jgi:hypothetical protein
VTVAIGWRDNAERRDKIFCRPKMAFLRGNLVRRVVRCSSEFSGPSSECKRRVPTTECPRSCPVHAGPDNRESLVPEMEVVGRRAHIGAVTRLCSNPRTSIFGSLRADQFCAIIARVRFSVTPRKTRLDNTISVPARNGFTTLVVSKWRTILSESLGKYSFVDSG